MYEDLIEIKESSENIFNGNLLHVKKDKVKLPNGGTAYREWIKHPGAAAVIPVTEDGQVILVRQYRYPIDEVTLEIPAGKHTIEFRCKDELLQKSQVVSVAASALIALIILLLLIFMTDIMLRLHFICFI